MKIKYIIISFLMAIFLAGCGANNSDVENESNITIPDDNLTSDENSTSILKLLILSNTSINVFDSNQTVDVSVHGYTNENTNNINTTLSVVYPSDVINSKIDMGYLPTEIEIVDGHGSFQYSAPENMPNTIEQLKSFYQSNIVVVTLYDKNSDVTANLSIEFNEVINVSKVILTEPSKTITLNNEIINIEVKVIDSSNNPYSSGNMKIIYPDSVGEGRDVGSFASSTVEVENGKAIFAYTAPNDIRTDPSNIEFGFYYEANPSQVAKYTIMLAPQENQIILTNYKINYTFDNNETMGLKSSKLLNFFVTNSKDEQVDNSKMQYMEISILNSMLGTLEDTLGNTGLTLTIKDKNAVTVNIKSNTISGIMPIKVETVFTDENNKEQKLSEVFNIIVLSGPPSAMSLSYAGTLNEGDEYEEANKRAKFIEKWVVTVTDKYNNLVNTNPSVSMGMMADYAKSSANTGNSEDYLYYLPSEGNATISLNGISVNSNIGSSDIFKKVDQTNDYLVTFGNGYTYNVSGKWDINTNTNDSTLDLVDNYDGITTSRLGFAVGHNSRQDASREGVEWVGNVYPENKNYIIDDAGSLIINVEYDYYLTGKDVMLWINLIGKNYIDDTTVRIGEAKKITLRGQGISSYIEFCSIPAGEIGLCKFCAKINGTSESYRHARFSAIPLSEYVSVDINTSAKISDNASCITYNARNTDLDTPQSLSIDMTILNEF